MGVRDGNSEKNASVDGLNAIDDSGKTALMHAVLRTDADPKSRARLINTAVNALIEQKVDVDIECKGGMTSSVKAA